MVAYLGLSLLMTIPADMGGLIVTLKRLGQSTSAARGRSGTGNDLSLYR